MSFNLQLNYDGFEKYHVVHGPKLDGVQYIFRFDNDYGASVVKWTYTFGYESDLWELGILQFDNDGNYSLSFDSPITDDVIGHLTDEEVCRLLGEIRDLPKKQLLIDSSH